LSRTVETNVVEMQFDNKNFEKNVNDTIKSVDKLKDSLTIGSETTRTLNSALDSIDLSKISSSVEVLADRFSTFGVVGMSVIQRLTNAAIDFGLTIERKVLGVVSAGWNQIITGGTSRAANIEQATFQLKGIFGEEAEGVAKLKMAMTGTTEEIEAITGATKDMIVAENAANYAVADTAYGLDSAAKAASVLATSGVDVTNFMEELADESGRARTEMQVALRAISGTAAMANSSYDDIARIYEKIAGGNRVMGEELNSLNAKGLNAAAVLANYLNETGRTANATEADIRTMCSKGEIDFMTFARAMDEAYGEHAKDANSTFSGAFDNMRFALSKIGADFISPLRDDLIPVLNNVRMTINAVRASLTPFTNAFKSTSAFITDKIVEKFHTLIGFGDTDSAWKESEQWNTAIERITTVVEKATDILFSFINLVDSVVTPIRQAREAILPSKGYSGIVTFLDNVNNLIRGMTLSASSMEKVNKIAKGFFSIFKIIGQVISPIVTGIINLGKELGWVKTSIVDATVGFADFLVELADSNKVFDIVTVAVQFLSSCITNMSGVLRTGIGFVSSFASNFVSKFNKIKDILSEKLNMSALKDIDFNLDSIKEKLEPITEFLQKFKDGIVFVGSKIVDAIRFIANKAKELIQGIFESIGTIFSDVPSYKKFENALDLSFFTTLFASVAVFIKKMAQYYGPLESISDKFEYFFKNNGEVWKSLTNFISDAKRAIMNLPEVINNLKASLSNLNTAIKNYANIQMFKAIALALVAFTASVYVLSKIDADKALAGIVAVGLIITYLKNVMMSFKDMSWDAANLAGTNKAIRGLLVMSVSVLILASAIKKISSAFDKNPYGAILGLVSIYVVIEMMMKVMDKILEVAVEDVLGKTPKVAKAFGLAMIELGVAIKLIASAMATISKSFDKNWVGTVFALGAIATLLEGSVLIFKQLSGITVNPKGVSKIGFALMEIGAAMVLMAVAIRIISGAFSGEDPTSGIYAVITVAGLMMLVMEVIKKLSASCASGLSGIFGIKMATSALIDVAISMAILGATIAVLAKSFSVNTFATMTAVATVITMMIAITVILNNLKPEKAISNALAMIEIALALSIVGKAIAKVSAAFATDPYAGLAGVGSLLLMLISMSIALEAINPAKANANAIALLEFSASLYLIALAVAKIGSLGLKDALVGVAGLIAVMAAIAGFAALVGGVPIVAAGLIIITACITSMGAAMLMAGAAFALFGVGLTTISAGITALATAWAVSGPMVIEGIVGTLSAIAMAIPTLAGALAHGLLTFVEVILDHVDVIVNLIGQIVMSIINSIAQMTPVIAQILVTLLLGVLDLIGQNIGPLVDKLITIFVNLLNAISTRLPEINGAISDFITPILEGLVGFVSGILSIIAEGIGEIFGSFIGALVNGIAKTLDRDSLVSFANTLSDFMLRLQPFMDGLKGLDESTMRAALMLALVITILTADDIARSLTSWLTGGNSMVEFGKQLAEFGPYIKAYSDSVKGIDVAAVEASTMAAQMIVDFARTIPNEGGLIAKIFGDNDIATFGAKLAQFGPFIRDYARIVDGIDVAAVDASINAAQMIADFARTIPNEGGLLAKITGDNDIETFGEHLKRFGKSISKYAEEVADIDGNAVEASVSAALMLTEFANKIPNTGGIKAIFEGDNSVEKFGESLAEFGKYISNYYQSISGINTAVMLDTAKALTDLLNILTVSDSLSISSVTNLQDILTKFAEIGLQGFLDAIAIDSADDVSDSIAEFFKTVENNFKEYAKLFNESAESIGRDFAAAYSRGIGSNESLQRVRAAASDLGEASVRALGDSIDDDPIEPSGATINNGLMFDLGYQTGIENGEDGVLSAVQGLADSSLGELDLGDEYFTLGQNNMAQYNAGIQSVGVNPLQQSIMNRLPKPGTIRTTTTTVPSHPGYFNPNTVPDKVENDTSYLGDVMRNYTRDAEDATYSTEELNAALGDTSNSANRASSSMGGLSRSTSGAGGSAKKAKSEFEILTEKLDKIAEKYENRWDTAKERANKDLFKGVDDQGDKFLDSVQDIMNQYQNIYTSAVEKTNGQDLFAEINDEDEAFAPETLLNNLEDQVNRINELNTIISSLSGRIADRNLAAAISNMDVDDLPQLRALYRMNAGQLAEYETMYQRKVQANQNKIQNELSGNLSQLTGSYVDVASYVATDASTTRLLHNLESQINQLNEYNSTIASLMTRIKDVHLREAIATMGVESLDELKALNAMTDTQLDQYVALYNNKITVGLESVSNELSAELSAVLGQPMDISVFYEMYKSTMSDIADQIAAGDSGARQIGTSTGEQIAEGMNDEIKESVDTEAAYAAGKAYVESIGKGMADPDAISYLFGAMDGIANMITEDFRDFYKEDLMASGTAMISYVIQGIEAAKDPGFDEVIDGIPDRIIEIIESKKPQFVNVGRFIVLGVKEGMTSPDVMHQVESAATQVAYKALKTIKEKLKIHSPSRELIEIGKYMDEGLAIGLKEYSKLAEDEAGNVADGSLTAIQEAINQLSGLLNGTIDLNPTITPTLDLSDVNARSAALANMFNGRQIAIQARNDEEQAEMINRLGDVLAEQNSEPRTMTFNQNNYSPKALSRTEIYRQTRNGFSQLASAIQ
jgi:hypothetical protein